MGFPSLVTRASIVQIGNFAAMDFITGLETEMKTLKVETQERILMGQIVALGDNGRVRLARDDNSMKARFTRWIGRLIKNHKMESHGIEKRFVGVAMQNASEGESLFVNLPW